MNSFPAENNRRGGIGHTYDVGFNVTRPTT